MTVAENLFINRQPEGRGGFISWRRLRREAAELLDTWDVRVDPEARTADLKVEDRQMVEIARALSFGARFIVLDEPTAQLDNREIERLFTRMRALQDSGVTFLFISHHLQEVYEVCQTVTVLRDARWITTAPVADLPRAALVEAMAGEAMRGAGDRRAGRGPHRGPDADAPVLLDVRGPHQRVVREHRPDRPQAARSSGLAGSSGSGKIDLAEAFAGTAHADRRHRPTRRRTAAVRRRAGAPCAPASAACRATGTSQGLVFGMTIGDNATMSVLDRLGPLRLRRHRRASAASPHELIDRLDIHAEGPDQPVSDLSGGNAQKVVMARALASDPRLLVLINPTAGVDVKSKESLLARVDTRPRGRHRRPRRLRRTRRPAALRPRPRPLPRPGRRRARGGLARPRADRLDRRSGPSGPDRGAGNCATSPHVPREDKETPWLTSRPRRQSAPPARPTESRAAKSILLRRARELALVPALLLLMLLGALVNDSFLTERNLISILGASAALAMVVLAESLVLITGKFDLSLESVVGIAPAVGALLVLPAAQSGLGTELPAAVALLAILVVGAVIGAFNGILVVKLKLNAFIVTLAMLIVLRGLLVGATKGKTLFGMPDSLLLPGHHHLPDHPACRCGWPRSPSASPGFVLKYHRVGRALYAIGGNPDAARAAGIRVERVMLGVFVVAGVLASVGGLMQTGYVGAISANQGQNMIFTVFAAAVIGGISLDGGKGTMFGALTGVLLLGVVQNLLTLAQVPSFWIQAIYGGIILVALMIARVTTGRAQD